MTYGFEKDRLGKMKKSLCRLIFYLMRVTGIMEYTDGNE